MSGTLEILGTAPAAPVVEPAAVAPVVAPVAPGTTLLTGAPDPAAPAVETPAAVVAPVVPEKYEFKAPEGVTFDQAQIDAFTPVAKELGLTNEQAQKLVDLQTTHAANAATAQAAQWKSVTDAWAAETKADKDIGGVKFNENVGIASKAIDKFGTPELRKALDDSGMGNHPAVVRFFVNVGRQISEDTMASGNAGGGGAPKTAAEILFPGMTK